jgi:hypothetical protein
MSKLRVLDPVEEPSTDAFTRAPRLDTLDGKVIGLYANNKLKTQELLDLVGEELTQRAKLKNIVRGTYNVGRLMEPEEWIDVEKCDAIVLTHGD